MRAGVDHIIVNVNDYAAAKKFYSWLMPQIGYPKAMSYDQAQTDVTTGYFGDHGSLWIRPSDPEFRADKFHRHRVGLCEIALAAESRQQIDERFERFMLAAAKLVRQRATDIAYVDMRYSNGFAVGWKGGVNHLARSSAPAHDKAQFNG